MTTSYKEPVLRIEVTATKPGGVDTPAILLLPEGADDFTIYAKGTAATSCKIEESASSAQSLATGTPTPVYMSVDATLDSVGTTQVRFALGTRTPVALKVTCLTTGETATLVLVGKRRASR